MRRLAEDRIERGLTIMDRGRGVTGADERVHRVAGEIGLVFDDKDFHGMTGLPSTSNHSSRGGGNEIRNRVVTRRRTRALDSACLKLS